MEGFSPADTEFRVALGQMDTLPRKIQSAIECRFRYGDKHIPGDYTRESRHPIAAGNSSVSSCLLGRARADLRHGIVDRVSQQFVSRGEQQLWSPAGRRL